MIQNVRTVGHPNSTNSLSATNSIYIAIFSQFMPTILTGKAFVKKSCSIVTASRIM